MFVGFLGSESKFIVPLARPSGAMLCIVMKLASDPNNPHFDGQRVQALGNEILQRIIHKPMGR